MIERLDSRPAFFLCLRTAVLLCTFVAVDRLVQKATKLSVADYEQVSIALALVQKLSFLPVLAVIAVGLVLGLRGLLACRWDALDHGGALRWFIVFLALLMAWPFTTYGYNYFLDRDHALDRAMLAAFVALLCWRPIFIYPFLLLVFAIMWQLGVPSLGGTIFAHKLQVLHVLSLFAAWMLVQSATRAFRASDFLFVTCCLVAGSYWEAGLAKLELNWITYGHLHRAIFAAYAHGWLSFLQPEQIVAFGQRLMTFDRPMGLAVLVIELGALLFLLHRSLSLALLCAVIVFHLAVFVVLGFLFWTWILLDAALLILLLYSQQVEGLAVHSVPHLLISLPLIALAGFWSRPPHLAWLDTTLSYTYRIDVIGESGTRYNLSPRFMAPYGDVFTMSAFSYLVEAHPVLTGPYGITKKRDLTEAIDGVTTADELLALEGESTDLHPHESARAERLYGFLERYLSHRNRRGEKLAWLAAFRPPAQFWSFDREDTYQGKEPIREVIVKEVTSWYDGRELREIRELELRRLQLPQGGPDGTGGE